MASSTEGTLTESSAPEFTAFDILAGDDAVEIAAIMEFTPPFEDRTIPVADDEPLVRMLVDVLGHVHRPTDVPTVHTTRSKLPHLL